MSRKGQHVISRGDKWAVRKTGSGRVARMFVTQRKAIKVAREFTRN